MCQVIGCYSFIPFMFSMESGPLNASSLFNLKNSPFSWATLHTECERSGSVLCFFVVQRKGGSYATHVMACWNSRPPVGFHTRTLQEGFVKFSRGSTRWVRDVSGIWSIIGARHFHCKTVYQIPITFIWRQSWLRSKQFGWLESKRPNRGAKEDPHSFHARAAAWFQHYCSCGVCSSFHGVQQRWEVGMWDVCTLTLARH